MPKGTFDVNDTTPFALGFSDTKQFFATHSELNELFFKVRFFNPTDEQSKSHLLPSSDTFASLVDELSSIVSRDELDSALETMLDWDPYKDRIKEDKIYKIVVILKSKARSIEDYHLLRRFVDTNPRLHDRFHLEFLQLAASEGDLKAMLAIMSSASFVHFKQQESFVRWSLECIRYLKKTVIPKLNLATDVDSAADLQMITTDHYYKLVTQVCSNEFGDEIPVQDSDDYHSLVQYMLRHLDLTHVPHPQYLEKSKTPLLPTVAESITPPARFLLSINMFQDLDSGRPLTPIHHDLIDESISNDRISRKQPEQIRQRAYDLLDRFECYLVENYKKWPQGCKIFLDECRAYCATVRVEQDSGKYYDTVRNGIQSLAKQHFHHRHQALRIVADLILIPLGIITLGAALGLKKYLTGSYTFFLDKKTAREEQVDKFVNDLKPKS